MLLFYNYIMERHSELLLEHRNLIAETLTGT